MDEMPRYGFALYTGPADVVRETQRFAEMFPESAAFAGTERVLFALDACGLRAALALAVTMAEMFQYRADDLRTTGSRREGEEG